MRKVLVLVSFEEELVLLDGSLSGTCKDFGLVNDVLEKAVDDEFVFDCLEGEFFDLSPETISKGMNKVHLIDQIIINEG